MPSRPTLIAQLSDPHIVVGRGDRPAARALGDAVRAVRALPQTPDAVVVSGDLSDDGAHRSYERARELLAPLEMAVFVLAGNHDDREAVREYFALAEGSTGRSGGPFHWSVRVGELRLIGCDTTRLGRGDGSLGAEQRAWLASELEADPLAPTVVAMHHPPIDVGLPEMDLELGLDRGDRAALAELLGRHTQVRRVVSGHVHRSALGTVGPCAAFTCTSTYAQARLDLDAPKLTIAPDPAGFAVHALLDAGISESGALGGELVTHVQPLG